MTSRTTCSSAAAGCSSSRGRAREARGVDVNALGFAGCLLARDAATFEALLAPGACGEVLRGVAVAASASGPAHVVHVAITQAAASPDLEPGSRAPPRRFFALPRPPRRGRPARRRRPGARPSECRRSHPWSRARPWARPSPASGSAFSVGRKTRSFKKAVPGVGSFGGTTTTGLFFPFFFGAGGCSTYKSSTSAIRTPAHRRSSGCCRSKL